jgi:hypothetical protein
MALGDRLAVAEYMVDEEAGSVRCSGGFLPRQLEDVLYALEVASVEVDWNTTGVQGISC